MNWGNPNHELGSVLLFVSYWVCLIGPVVTPWSLIQDVAGLNNHFIYKIFSLNSVSSTKIFRENSNSKAVVSPELEYNPQELADIHF